MMETSGRLLLVRLHRLTHLPPAHLACALLTESGIPCLVVELGEGQTELVHERSIPKARWNPRFLRYFGPLKPIVLLISSAFWLEQTIRRGGKPALMVSHGLFEQCLVFWLSHRFRIPYFAHVHEIYDPRDLSLINRLLLLAEKSMLKRARFLIFPGAERRSLYVARYGLKQTTFVVPNCPRLRPLSPRTDRWRKQLGIGPTEQLMVYIGGIGDSNSIREGIIALCGHPNLHFALAGWCAGGDRAAFDDTSRAHGVTSRVHFMGPIKDEKWELLADSDVAFCVYKPTELRLTCNAMPSNKLLEALAAGVPTLGGTTADFAAFYKRYPVGVFVPSATPEAISESLTQLFAQEIARMRNEAHRVHRDELHYEKQFAPVKSATMRFFSPSPQRAEAQLPTSHR